MSAVQIDTPFAPSKIFLRRSGIPENSIRNKIFKGEMPTIKTKLVETKAGAVYLNLLKLMEEASEGGGR